MKGIKRDCLNSPDFKWSCYTAAQYSYCFRRDTIFINNSKMSNARFLLDRFFFLDDLTGFEITLLLEVSIDKLKSYYMLLFLFRALGFWTRIKKFYNSTSLSLIISCSILKVVSHELEDWKLKIGVPL